jgi:excisionase family DNA binding protein
MKDLITADDLAKRLGTSRSQVYQLARSGICPSYRVGRYYRFDLDRVLAGLEAKREEVTGPGQIGDIGNGQREV